MKKSILALLVVALGATSVLAHNIWASKNEKEVKLYFGDWADDVLEKGDRLNMIKTEVVLPSNNVKQITREEGFILIELEQSIDTVVINEREPRKSRISQTLNRSVTAARAGRNEPAALATLDMIPQKPNSNTFTLMYQNKPLAKKSVTVYSPTTWSKTFKTNDKGEFTLHTPWQGEYMIEVKHEDNTAGKINEKPYESTNYTTTLTFNVQNGIAWGRPLPLAQ
jgi:uncharacterized GH25 family protein